MKTTTSIHRIGPLLLLLVATLTSTATTRYVNLNNPAPAPPYTNRATAATNIQNAVDAASAGDEVVVTNGIYEAGGRTVAGSSLTNRVAVDRALTLRSVNGPEATIIRGDLAVRCVFLTDGVVLSGFTLTNAITFDAGGGLWCTSTNAVATNCLITGNSASYVGGGASGGTLNNCTLSGNSADEGGGAYDATLNNCTLSGNSAYHRGGGTLGGMLNGCTLTGNSSSWYGGGACYGTLNKCTLSSNSADAGGGAYGGTLNNCILSGNTANDGGAASGGFVESILDNCTLTGNSAINSGGGVYQSTLNNCTLTGNSTTNYGGGASDSTLNNCIVYYNAAFFGANYFNSSLNYCCTTPLPPAGTGNITEEPALLGEWSIAQTSPCQGAGSGAYAGGTDMDGEPWLNPPSIGADEYYAGSVTGPLAVALSSLWTNVATGFSLECVALVSGRATALRWEFGDGTVVSNQFCVFHHWVSADDYEVVLRAYNDTYPAGVTATLSVHIMQAPVHYVALNSSHPVAPYTNWTTAATNIQDAVDAAMIIGGTVLVSNGVYQTGGRDANRVAVTKPITLRSVSGPEVTEIRGAGKRCVYLTNNTALSGFTLRNGGASAGGGVYCESASATVSNCVIVQNQATPSGVVRTAETYTEECGGMVFYEFDGVMGYGGGAAGGTYYRCVVSGNWATIGGGAYAATLIQCALSNNTADYYDPILPFGHPIGAAGGGVYRSLLYHCTLSGNLAWYGGGAQESTMSDCLLFGNGAYLSGGGAAGGTLVNCVLAGNSGGGAVEGVLPRAFIVVSACPEEFTPVPIALNNCIVYDNGWYNYDGGLLNYCCTTPMPTNGIGNFTNAPLFVDAANNNFRLQSNSPCINAGNNAYAASTTDLDGNPRIVGSTVDIGAYEYQSPQSLLSYAWLQQYGLSTDGSADFTDTDGDGHNNWQEWRAWTDPTNPVSALRLLSPTLATNGIFVRWQSVSGQTYFLERATNLAAQLAFAPLASNVVGQAGTTVFTDTNTVGPGPFFYRVGVR